MVSRSIAGLGSIGIVVKERYSVGEIIPTGVAMLPLILRVYESCRYDKGVMHYRIAVKMCRLGQKNIKGGRRFTDARTKLAKPGRFLADFWTLGTWLWVAIKRCKLGLSGRGPDVEMRLRGQSPDRL
jgi:hypothetical protein